MMNHVIVFFLFGLTVSGSVRADELMEAYKQEAIAHDQYYRELKKIKNPTTEDRKQVYKKVVAPIENKVLDYENQLNEEEERALEIDDESLARRDENLKKMKSSKGSAGTINTNSSDTGSGGDSAPPARRPAPGPSLDPTKIPKKMEFKGKTSPP